MGNRGDAFLPALGKGEKPRRFRKRHRRTGGARWGGLALPPVLTGIEPVWRSFPEGKKRALHTAGRTRAREVCKRRDVLVFTCPPGSVRSVSLFSVRK